MLNKKRGLFMNNKNQKGVTLVELIISIAIITVALFAILSVYQVSVNNSADPVTRRQAVLVAESVLEEVLGKPFVKPVGGFAGPFTSANRESFDTITDYNGLSIVGVKNIQGVAVPGLENYNVTVLIENKAFGVIPIADSLWATVTVVGPNDTFVLKGYRAKYE